MTEQTPTSPEPFIRMKEVTSYFGVTSHTIYAWCKKLRLPAHRFTKGKRGGRLLFKLSEIHAWERQFKDGVLSKIGSR